MVSARIRPNPSQTRGPRRSLLLLTLIACLAWAGTALADQGPAEGIVAQRLARVVGEWPTAGTNADSGPLEVELGGEDVLVDVDADNPAPRLQITSTGVIYIAMIEFDVFAHQFDIYRSDDGGRSFFLWSVFEDPGPQHFKVDDFRIIEGDADRAFLVYTLPAATREIKVAWAALTDESPTWNIGTALSAPGVNFHYNSADLETDADSFANYYLYLTAAGFDATGDDIWFTRSTDMGATWETGYRVANDTDTDDIDFITPRLSFGYDGNIHLAYLRYDRNSGVGLEILYQRAGNYAGAGAASWDEPVTLFSATGNEDVRISALEASKGDGTVLAHLVDLSDYVIVGSRLIWSADDGATWPAANEVATGVAAPYGTDLDIESDGGSVWLLGRDPFGAPGTWELQSQRTTLANPGNLSVVESWCRQDDQIDTFFYPKQFDIEHDPSRGNQRAVVWGLRRDSAWQIYFDAEWHRDPGWPNLEAGFPLPLGGTGRTPPAIANVDADPFGEIIFATEEGLIYVVNHDGTIADGWPVDLNEGIAWDSPVAVGDLNGDDEPEIVVGTVAGRVFAYHPDGTIVSGWPVDMGTGADTYVSIGTLGPPSGRYVVGCSGNRLRVYKFDGEDVSPSWGTAVGEYTSPAAIGDIDDDGTNEIITHQPGSIHAHRLGSGAQLAFRLFSGEVLSGMPALADFDEDGDLEIAVGTISGKVYLMHHDFTDYGPGFPYDTGNNSAVMGVVAANLLGIPRPELVFSQLDGTTHIVYETGNAGDNYPKSTATNDFVYMPPIVTNVHLSSPDVVVSAGTSLYCWENLGAVPGGWPREMGNFIEESAAAGDLDQDGNIEIVALGLNELRVFDVGNPPGSGAPHMTWPMYGFDAQRTGCLDCAEDMVSAVDDSPTPGGTTLAFAPPFPNPASSRTALSYALPAAAQVKLQIFDVRGHLVRTLADGQQEAGRHEVFWNGTHANGRRVALGLYLAKLSVSGPGGQEERVRKISLVR